LPFECQANADHFFRVAEPGSITPLLDAEGRQLSKRLKFKSTEQDYAKALFVCC